MSKKRVKFNDEVEIRYIDNNSTKSYNLNKKITNKKITNNKFKLNKVLILILVIIVAILLYINYY
jgi:hypothetical protein